MKRISTNWNWTWLLATFICVNSQVFGQSVSINSTGTAADAQSILDITSTSKGVLLPRMTDAQATTLALSLDAGDDGMIIYVTDNSIKAFKYWDGQGLTWRTMPNTSNIVTTLDGAYDGLGSGAGRVITADAGAVDIQGANGLLVSGNVGIGNTNADYKLQISGGTGGSETRLLNLHSNSSTIATGSVLRFTNSTSTTSSPGSGEIVVKRTNRDATGDAAMYFRTSNGSGAPADRMTITDNGFVGIGTIVPDYELDVVGDVGINQYLIHNGNVDTKLEFGSDQVTLWAGGINMVDVIEVTGTDRVVINNTTTDVDFNVQGSTDANLLFSDASTNRIGVGTNTPGYKLDVVGDINLTGAVRVAGNAGTSGYVLTSSGGGAVTWQPSYTGDITSVIAGAGLINGGTTGDVTLDAAADNGLNVDATADRIQLGGALTEATTITNGAFDLTVNLDGTGQFVVQDGGVDHFLVAANGDAFFGSDTYFKDTDAAGTDLVKISDAGVGGNDGKLEVFADGTVNHTIAGDGDVIFNSQGLDRDFKIEGDTDANTFYLDASTNRIGMGTSSPDAKLNVGEPTGGNIYITREDPTTAQNDVLGSLLFDSTDDTAPSSTDASAGIRAFAAEDHGNSNKGGYLTFFTKPVSTLENAAATERLRITSAGNIGIGTTTPYQKLHVSGSVRVSTLAGGGNVKADANGDLILSNDLVSGDADYIQNQYSAQQSSSEYWISGRGRMDGGLTVGAGATLDNNNTNVGTVAAGALAFGNASGEGIGSKRSAGGNAYGLDFYTNSVNRLAITNGGNVGIGTTGPTAPLQVTASSTTPFDIGRFDGSNTVGSAIYLNSTATSGRAWQLISTAAAAGEGAGKLLFKDATGGSVKMTIESGGNVGIGTASPVAKLDISGNVAMNDNQIRLRDGADGNHYIAYVGGAVDGAKIVGNLGVVISNTNGSQDVAFFKGDYSYFGFDPGSCCNGYEKVKVGRGRNADGTVEFMNNGWGRLGATSGLAFWANGNADVDDSPQMIISSTGYVGIGTTSPSSGKLHVSGVGASGTYGYGYLNSSGGTGTCGSCGVDYSIWADGRIRASEFNAMSDQRIKTVVGHTNTEELLALANRLSVTEYEYIDKIEHGDQSKQGFIAQQVEQVVPTAVKISKDFIPNVYSLAHEFSFRDGLLTVKLTKKHGLKVGDEVKIITEKGELISNVALTNDSESFVCRIENEPTQVFVYGKKVDDFRAVDYDQIFSIGIGAIQELSKENDQLKAEVESLKAQLNDLNGLKAEIDLIKSTLNMDVLGASKK